MLRLILQYLKTNNVNFYSSSTYLKVVILLKFTKYLIKVLGKTNI